VRLADALHHNHQTQRGLAFVLIGESRLTSLRSPAGMGGSGYGVGDDVTSWPTDEQVHTCGCHEHRSAHDMVLLTLSAQINPFER
jgi:hypothetical protein